MGEPSAARADRDSRDREVPDGSWPTEIPDDREGDEGPVSGPLAVLDDARFAMHASRTTNDKIDYAIHGAYDVEQSFWRTTNIVFAYVVAAPGTIVCDVVRWALFDKLSRFLLAVPVLVAVLFMLNQVPVIELAVPDQWDISSWFPRDSPDLVEVPIVAPPPRAVG